MTKQDILSYYFMRRAFNAGTETSGMTVDICNAAPGVSIEQAQAIAQMFATKLQKYMAEAEEWSKNY